MTTARKVLDWHGQGGDELVKELERLPAGRYVLVPENEVDEAVALAPDEEAAVREGLADIDRGDTDEGDEVVAAARARVAAAVRRP
jgi:hypothetical protein